MKSVHSMIAALALAFVLPAPATAATTDPEIVIYRFPGVLDDGSTPFNGSQPSFIAPISVAHGRIFGS